MGRKITWSNPYDCIFLHSNLRNLLFFQLIDPYFTPPFPHQFWTASLLGEKSINRSNSEWVGDWLFQHLAGCSSPSQLHFSLPLQPACLSSCWLWLHMTLLLFPSQDVKIQSPLGSWGMDLWSVVTVLKWLSIVINTCERVISLYESASVSDLCCSWSCWNQWSNRLLAPCISLEPVQLLGF